MDRPLLISAAEPSGDRLGAEVARFLRPRLHGLVGPALCEMGVDAVGHAEDVTAMGTTEVLAKVPGITRTRRRLVRKMSGSIGFVGVDAPDFHQTLGRQARELGIPAVGIVSPQLWAWRPKRAAKIATCWDALLCLFDFEPGLYADTGLAAHFVGHPVLDRRERRTTVDPDLFLLLPGSRPQELKRHDPIFARAAETFRGARPNARFVTVGNNSLPSWVDRAGDLSEVDQARGALTKSGTVTLELAVMGIPQVVAHQTSALTYALGRRLIRGVQHISLPNILSRQAVVPEFVQDLDPKALSQAMLALPDHQEINLAPLGQPGAAKRMADHIHEVIGA